MDLRSDANPTGCARHSRWPCAGAERRPFIIPIFIPHAGCPHRCVFCDQTAISGTPRGLPNAAAVGAVIERYLTYRKPTRGRSQISFYGGNLLGLPEADLLPLLQTGDRYVGTGRVDSLRCSTRPDTIDPARLDLLAAFPMATIELGVQSMDDGVLQLSRRDHTAADTERAVGLLKQRGLEVGLQMMVGLPGDNPAQSLASADRMIRLAPDFIRIYPTLVLEHSLLAAWYRQGRYRPSSLAESVDLVKKLYLRFRQNKIAVIRMGLQATAELDNGSAVLAGPYHPAFGHLVQAAVFFDRAVELLQARHDCRPGSRPMLRVHPRSISRMRGLNNQNIKALKSRFDLDGLDCIADHGMDPDAVALS